MLLKSLGVHIALVSVCNAGITLTPVVLNLKAGEKITTVEVINTGSEPISYQLDVHEWDDRAFAKIGKKDDQWIISPKILTIIPGKSQLVRLSPKQQEGSDTERHKRLMLRQINTQEKSNAVSFQTNMSLPIFIDSREKTDQKPTVEINEGVLTVRNPNNHHITLGELRSESKKQIIGGYVLPAEKYSIKLPFMANNGKSYLDYEINGKIKSIQF